ncbi:hypothetical protein ACRRTK_019791 [Alexandromys fortis]
MRQVAEACGCLVRGASFRRNIKFTVLILQLVCLTPQNPVNQCDVIRGRRDRALVRYLFWLELLVRSSV